MRCSNCKAYLPYDSKKKECPSCGTKIKKKPFFEDMANMTAEVAADKNFIFWGFVSLIIWIIVGAVDFGMGGGVLFDYFEANIFYTLVLSLYWGFIIDLVAKINAQIRLASKTVILKERRNLRMFRLGTNLSLISGLLLSFLWIGPENFLARFPGITLITSICICIFWAIEGVYFQEEHFEDHRVRNFFLLIGIRHPHPYRIASAWFLSGISVSAVVYFGLTMFPSIFRNFYNTWLVQSTIEAVQGFIKYLPA